MKRKKLSKKIKYILNYISVIDYKIWKDHLDETYNKIRFEDRKDWLSAQSSLIFNAEFSLIIFFLGLLFLIVFGFLGLSGNTKPVYVILGAILIFYGTYMIRKFIFVDRYIDEKYIGFKKEKEIKI